VVANKTTGRIFLLIVVLSFLPSCRQNLLPAAPLRVATHQSIPFNFFNKEGRAVGFAVEVFERAANLRGYQVQWIATNASPTEAITNGTADFWPFLSVFPERKKIVHIAKPYWRSPTAIYFPATHPITKTQDLAHKRLAFGLPGISTLFSNQIPASTRRLENTSDKIALLALCRSEADAAWLDPRYVEPLLMDRPLPCRDIALDSIRVPNSARIFSLASNFAHSRQADELRDAIDVLAESGELMDIALRWKLIQESDSILFDWISQRTQETQLQRLSLICLAVLLAMTLVFLRDLMKARAAAERSAVARSSFLATMSHEIRTPMNGILGMTDLALQGPIPEQERGYLVMARDSGRALLQILNDILDFSRVESGKLELESIPFSLREVAQRSLQIFHLSAAEKGLELRAELDPALPEYVLGDPGRIQQVLINLLGNAVKFTTQGSITLRLGPTPSASGQPAVHFEVADTGIGIPLEKQPGIFEAFTQADASTTRRFGGTGLGLSISSGLIRQMGGQIQLRSTPGQGSCFSFRLPLPLAQAPAPVSVDVAGPLPGAETSAVKRTLSILVVEDNAVNSFLIERILSRAGHQVQLANNGQEALDILATRSFDAILMDMQMPVMDGLEATRQIRAREQQSSRHTPVIALTANAMPGDADTCLKAGMDAYLSKPVDARRLLALLQQLASPAKQKDPLPTPAAHNLR
jgi:signal transduction histidine kinase/ActR/RegA family two-component response regulator